MNKYYKMLDFETIISKIAKNFKTKKVLNCFKNLNYIKIMKNLVLNENFMNNILIILLFMVTFHLLKWKTFLLF